MLQQIALLSVSSAGAQAISLSFVPILSRLYAPQDYGLLGIVSGISIIAASLLALTLPQALLLARTVAEQTAVLLATAIVLLSLALGTSLVLEAGILLFPSSSLAASIRDYGWAALAISSLIVANNTLQAWSTTHQRYLGTAVQILGRTLAICAWQFALAGSAGPVAGDTAMASAFGSGLVLGYLYGELTTLAVSVLWFGLGPRRLPRVWPGLARIAAVYREQRHVMVYGTSREILHAGTVTLPLVAIGAMFGSAAAGHFAMASRLLDAPATLIGTAVRTVMMQALSGKDSSPEARAALLTTWTLRLAGPGVLLLIAILVGADWGVAWLLGPQWAETAVVLKLLVLWKVLSFCKAPASAYLYATARDAHTAFYQIVGFVVMVLALLACQLLTTGEFIVIGAVGTVGLMIDLWFIGDALRLARRDRHRALAPAAVDPEPPATA